MSAAGLEGALDAVRTWPRPPQVHLTGGEPFLHFDLLEFGVRAAARRGIHCYVETSASWCVDEGKTLDRFSALRDAGLQAVLISCSPFHAETIPPKRTLLAVRAASEVFGPQRVIVYLPQYLELIQRFDLERPTTIEQYAATFGRESLQAILWQGYGIISGGRSGYQLGHLVHRSAPTGFAGMSCAGEILYAHHSHFDLYGNYISGFCGGLTIGSWRELAEVLQSFRAGRYPALIARLIETGPYGLFEYARERFAYEPLPEGYAGKCHLCVDVRRHLVQHAEFPHLTPAGFYTQI